MFKVGMLVRPKDLSWCYTTYKEFIEQHELYKYKFVNDAEPSTDKLYRLVYIAPHTYFKNSIVAVIVDEDTMQCYIMALKERALEIIKESVNMLVKDFITEFKATFTKKVVGRVAVPGCVDTVLVNACYYPVAGTGFQISDGNIVAPIIDSEGEKMDVLMFKVDITYTYNELSCCSIVENIELSPADIVSEIENYENKTTKQLIESVKSDILKGNTI